MINKYIDRKIKEGDELANSLTSSRKDLIVFIDWCINMLKGLRKLITIKENKWEEREKKEEKRLFQEMN